MLEQWIKAAENDEPVWISDVRRELNGDPDCAELSILLTLFDGSSREFCCNIPEWKTEKEKLFLTDYVASTVYNMRSALGGRDPEYVYDPENTFLSELLKEVELRFTASSGEIGRITREMNRIIRLTDGLDNSNLREDSQTGNRKDGKRLELTETLHQIVEKSLIGTYAGIDIGGTDIKLAAAVDGKLAAVLEYDWNPGAYPTADMITGPVMELAEELLCRTGAKQFDGIGLSYPDVVIRNRICGGETPKTQGLRQNPDVEYESEFSRVAELWNLLKTLCRETAPVRIANDGSVAALSSAAELAFSENPELIVSGVFSHAMGTSLGTGWIDRQGNIPQIPLEFYDSIIDLGSYRKRGIRKEDLRSTRSSSNVYSVDRYLGQASAFRYAYEIAPELLKGYMDEKDGDIRIISEPKDMRKPCLEHLMVEAENGNPDAQRIFFQIGEAFGRISEEVIFFLHPETPYRQIFGRFVKHPHVFDLLRSGAGRIVPEIKILPADDSMAYTPLMHQLAERKDITVAQFGQAIGAIYLALQE